MLPVGAMNGASMGRFVGGDVVIDISCFVGAPIDIFVDKDVGN